MKVQPSKRGESALTCISCDSLAGKVQPPGGIVYENDAWAVFLRQKPLLTPCYGFIVLKRHCEEISELSEAEWAMLPMTMQLTARAFKAVMQPEKIHFSLYGEGVKHVHWHVFPRTANLPAGNIPLTFLHVWADVLGKLRLWKPYEETQVAAVAHQLRSVFLGK